MNTTDKILAERGQTYGPFIHNASVAQKLKAVIFDALQHGGKPLNSPDMQEALDMICSKISRIVTSSATHVDNWDDIAGYARLVADRLRKESSNA